MWWSDKTKMVAPEAALAGRETPIEVPGTHAVNGRPLAGPFPEDTEQLWVGMGCFWGAERVFWQREGVWVTSVGYSAGFTPNPTYEEVCSGRTGHNEVVRVVYRPSEVSTEELLRLFWESHDPTQGMRQGNDAGTQYRSGIYWTTAAQRDAAEAGRAAYQKELTARGYGQITTEILPAPAYYFAEAMHQQYLSPAKNPNGYCGLGGTGVSCPVGLGVER